MKYTKVQEEILDGIAIYTQLLESETNTLRIREYQTHIKRLSNMFQQTLTEKIVYLGEQRVKINVQILKSVSSKGL